MTLRFLPFSGIALAAGLAACGSSNTTSPGGASPTLAGIPTQASTLLAGPCGQLTVLLTAEQSAIQALRSGAVSGQVGEGSITGINGELAHAVEAYGRSSVLGIAITQLVSENGTLSAALNQSVPVANLGLVFGSIAQDISNIENNCHG
jgi:hypothetical protein